MPKEITLVKNVDLIKTKTITQKIFDQIPRIDDYQYKHEDPNDYLVVGVVHDAILILQKKSSERLATIHITTFMQWKNFVSAGDREHILEVTPQIFLS